MNLINKYTIGVIALSSIEPHSFLIAIDIGDAPMFEDGFETGDTSAWSTSVQ